MKFKINQIAQIIDGTVEGDGEVLIDNISSIENGQPNTISFLSNPKYEQFIYDTKASAVIVNDDFTPKKDLKTTLIRTKNAYTSLTLLLDEYHRLTSFSKSGIDKNTHIADTAKYEENLYLGAFAYIGENVKIGKNVKIYPHCYIGDNTQIGDNTILYSGVKIYANTQIGKHCTFQAGAVIGSDGFGFAPQADGSYKTIPQLGNVIIEDHVDIGANTTIDCATFGSTKIEQGVKIDNLVQIAHNVEVGENTVIASQTGISGSTKIGKQVIIAGQVGVVGHVEVGNNATLAAKSGISNNVPENSTFFGYPAYNRTDYIKSFVIFKKLPQMMKQIQELEKKVIDLQKNN